MTRDLRATVILKRANKSGTGPILHHILKPEVYRDPDANERNLRDRLLWSETNLPVGLDRASPRMLSKVMDGYFEGRAERNHLSVVLSVEKCPDPKEYMEAVERLKLAASAWVKRFAPNSRYLVAIHGDKFHPHAHIIVCNWDPVNRRSLTFSPRQLTYMNSLDWCPPAIGLIAGAGLYATAQDFVAPKTANMRALVGSIRIDPAGRVAAMLEAGTATWYQYPNKKDTVNWGLSVKDGAGRPHRYSLAGINYALRQAGCPYGVARKELEGAPAIAAANSLALPKRDTIAQQNQQHLAMGVHYGKCSREEYEQYLYDHDVLDGATPGEQKELHAFLYGPDPDPELTTRLRTRLEKVTNAHLKRRLIYNQRDYTGPNHKVVGYLYRKKSTPGPAQRRMANRITNDFTKDYGRRPEAWEQFLLAVGTAFEQLGELVMPDLPL